MRKHLIPLLLCLPVFLSAQHEFAPLGATWYYKTPSWQSEPTGIFTIRVAGFDTIQNHVCKRLKYTGGSGCAMDFQYFYQEDHKVYRYDLTDSTFYLYLDFGANVGESWIVKTDPVDPQGFMTITVESISWLYLSNGDSLRVQHISYPGHWEGGTIMYWGERIVERIGNMNYIAPQVSVCDPQAGGFLCYQDPVFEIPLNCSEIVATKEPVTPFLKGLLFPNPASETVSIHDYLEADEVMLQDIFGKQIRRQLNNGNSLVVNDLAPGIYLVMAFKKGSFAGSDKLIIQR